MARLVLILAGAALGTLAAGCGGGGGIPEGLSDVRVCTEAVFDPEAQECARDQRGGRLLARSFYCSAKVGGRGGKRLVIRFFASGEVVYRKVLRVPEDSVALAARYFRRSGTPLGDRPQLGGSWRCALAVGADRASVRFRSRGPTNLVLDVRACATARTRNAGGAAVCVSDESGAPLRRVRSITCSALVAGAKGTEAQVLFIRKGRALDVFRTVVPNVSSPLAARLDAPRRLRKGSYTCRFFLAARPLAEKRFTIG